MRVEDYQSAPRANTLKRMLTGNAPVCMGDKVEGRFGRAPQWQALQAGRQSALGSNLCGIRLALALKYHSCVWLCEGELLLASRTPIFVRILVPLCGGLELLRRCGRRAAASCHHLHGLPLSNCRDQGYQRDNEKCDEVHRGEHSIVVSGGGN
jgi:hypothetical protein